MSEEREGAKPLTVKQVAEHLGVPIHRVKLAVARLGDGIDRQIAVRAGMRGAPQRLYGSEAVAAIRRQLDKEQHRKARATHDAAGWWQRLARLRLGAQQLGRLAGELKAVYTEMRRHPPTLSTTLSTLPGSKLALVQPIPVLLAPLRSTIWQASWPEARIEARAATSGEALRKLRDEIVRTWQGLVDAPESDPERFQVLSSVIR